VDLLKLVKVMKGRRKYDAAFKQEVLQMIYNGRQVKDISQSPGIGENLIYRWKSHTKQSSAAAELCLGNQEALHKRIRELEMERDILKKPWPFSPGRHRRGLPVHAATGRRLSGTSSLPGAPPQQQCALQVAGEKKKYSDWPSPASKYGSPDHSDLSGAPQAQWCVAW
jgi:transposase